MVSDLDLICQVLSHLPIWDREETALQVLILSMLGGSQWMGSVLLCILGEDYTLHTPVMLATARFPWREILKDILLWYHVIIFYLKYSYTTIYYNNIIDHYANLITQPTASTYTSHITMQYNQGVFSQTPWYNNVAGMYSINLISLS